MKEVKYCLYCGELLEEKTIEGKIRKYCPHCGYVHYINPIPIVAIVVRDNGKILLVKRGIEPEKGRWTLPGGYVDDDESPEEAAKRELKEETNLDSDEMRLITMVSTLSDISGPVLMLGYEALKFKGDIKAGDDAVAVEFRMINNLEKDVAFYSHRVILEKMKTGLTSDKW